MRLRLILSFVLIVLLTVVSMAIIARRNTASQVRAYMFRGGMTMVGGLTSTLEEYYQVNQTWQGVEDLLILPAHMQGLRRGNSSNQLGGQGMMAGMLGQRLRLADATGNLVADTAEIAPTGRLSASELGQAIPLQVKGKVVGYLLTEGGARFSPTDEINLLRRLNRAALSAALIAGAISLVLALVLGYRLLRPVQDLTRAAHRLAQGDLTQRVAVQGKDELATLGTAFNQMAAALQQSEESRRAMTADIAHELRTPLAVQRAHLEALQDGIYPATPENLAPILDQNLLLTRLVDDLRTLTLAETGQLHLEFKPTDFNALVQRIVDQFIPQADTKQVAIHFSSQTPCAPVWLDPGRVEQIVGNLLSNALRYTPEGGRITLALTCMASGVHLEVHDSGPGIAEEALPHVFERFYRADRARSRAEGGSGLGLAIARQLAQAHGGTLTVANHPAGGAVFTLELTYNQGQ